jgi:hypothetical protein
MRYDGSHLGHFVENGFEVESPKVMIPQDGLQLRSQLLPKLH